MVTFNLKCCESRNLRNAARCVLPLFSIEAKQLHCHILVTVQHQLVTVVSSYSMSSLKHVNLNCITAAEKQEKTGIKGGLKNILKNLKSQTSIKPK